MPIVRINDDGTVRIARKSGKDPIDVKPEELAKYNPELVGQYNTYKKEQDTLLMGGEESQLKPQQENLINQLEKSFFGEDLQQPLAAAKEGFGGRLPGVMAEFKRKTSPGEPGSDTEKLNSYIRTLESIRPQLAKMAGDSGNIAYAEQLQAGKGLPQVTDTPTEAIEMMQSAREKFGMERSAELDALKDKLIEKGVSGKNEPTIEQLQGRGYLQRLFSLEATKQMVGDIPEAVGGGVVKTGQNIADLLKGDTASIKQRSEEFRPTVEEFNALGMEARGEIGDKVEVIAGLASLKNWLAKRGGAKATQVSDDILQEGLKTIEKGGKARKKILEQASKVGKKVDGTKYYNDVVEWSKRAKRAYGNKKFITDKVEQAAKWKGKKLNVETAFNLWEDMDSGFTSASKAGKGMSQNYFRSARQSVRNLLDEAAPGFDEMTKLMREGFKREKLVGSVRTGLQRAAVKEAVTPKPSALGQFLKSTGGKVAGGAATGLGLAGVAKLLGLQFPGAAYPEQ